MSVTVELQDMFSYSPLFLLVLVVLGIIGVLLWIRRRKGKPIEQQIENVPVQEVKPLSTDQVKGKYMTLINELEKQYGSGRMSEKEAYQELSGMIRRFVYEMTGIKVHHSTLEDIRRMNMPNVSGLIEECYAPEFSQDKNGNIYNTINKARMVIREWH